MESAFSIGLVLLILGMAAFAVLTRGTFGAVVGFVVYGLLLAAAWMCLSAPDVALTEAADRWLRLWPVACASLLVVVALLALIR